MPNGPAARVPGSRRAMSPREPKPGQAAFHSLTNRLALVVLSDGDASVLRGDINPPGLECFRHLALQIDNQQAVLQGGAGDLHMIGQIEGLLEGTGRDPAVHLNTLRER
jgi:hypothetical protein